MVVSEANRLNSEEEHQHTDNEKYCECVIRQHFRDKQLGQKKRFEDVSFVQIDDIKTRL